MRRCVGRRALLSTLLLLVAALLLPLAQAVDRSKFRTCAQTQFCNKYRTQRPDTTYQVVPARVAAETDRVLFELAVQGDAAQKSVLQGSLSFVIGEASATHPAVRVRVVEKFDDPNDPRTRWENKDVLQAPAHEARVLKEISVAESGLPLAEGSVKLFTTATKTEKEVIVALRFSPFGVDLYLDKQKSITTNADEQFHYEIRQNRGDASAASTTAAVEDTNADVHEGKTIVDYGEDGLAIYSDGTVQKKAEPVTVAVVAPTSNEGWEESFGGHTDKKKFGPSSIGLDIVFPGATNAERGLYGIPEHASDFLLKNTIETTEEDDGSAKKNTLGDPYRLYNLDVFEFELDERMALYGSIPLLVAPNADNTVGVFWHNPTETFVDIETVDGTKKSHWMSESGVLDVFLLVGPTTADFFNQYTLITGRAQMPPAFAIGYHQCRWNYNNEADVDRVNAGFDEHLIPYDVIWLDIEHTQGKRYFTWDSYAFPHPLEMQERVARVGRKMVTIVDPHISRVVKSGDSYYVHEEATSLGLYIKNEQGQDFNGWCWPGDSSYVDFTSPKARLWWSSLFRYEKYQHSSKHLFTWNDMNEPSVFNGPEVSMRKTTFNLEGQEHREWHNIYGMYLQQATMEGQLVRQLPSVPESLPVQRTSEMHRPFVLSRAFFAGSQRFGAVWTGDNTAEWGQLKYATKMLLSMSVAGLTFVGADIGGFFKDPTPELLTRWYQAAAFQPFFRGHAHHDSKRREPWVMGEPHTSRIREAIRTRYALMPYVYTLFHECATLGLPVMRPLWMHFAGDARSFTEEDQFLLGQDLLIKPIVDEGLTETDVFLPSLNTVWYNIHDNYKRYNGGQVHASVPAPIESTPVFQRGGSILPRKNRVRRSSALMLNDPVTLVVALDDKFEASGKLYLDDEQTFAHEVDGAFAQAVLSITPKSMKSTLPVQKFVSLAWVERIEIYGFQSAANVPKTMRLRDGQTLEFSYDSALDRVVVRKPGMLVTAEWEILFE